MPCSVTGIAGELFPFGNDGRIIFARLEKKTGDEDGEECTDEEGD